MQFEKCSFAISRGKFLKIGLAFLCEKSTNAFYTSFYDNYDLNNLIKYIKKCKICYSEENDFLKYLPLKNIILVTGKKSCEKIFLEENENFYANIALNILHKNEKIKNIKELPSKFMQLFFNIEILNIFRDFMQEKNIKINKKMNYEIHVLQPFSSEEEIIERRKYVEYFKNTNILELEGHVNYDNSIIYEENIYIFFIKFMQIYKIMLKIKSMNYAYFNDFDDIILPDFINLEKIYESEKFDILKKSKIPFLDNLVEIYKSYIDKLENIKKEINCEYKIGKEIYFIEKKIKKNESKYFLKNKIIIRESKNQIIFTTKEVQKLSLKIHMIEDQTEDLIRAFLKDNIVFDNIEENKLCISYQSLRKMISTINKIQEMIFLTKLEGGTEIMFSDKMIFSRSPPIYCCKRIPFNILYGNNMSGKSTYLMHIFTKILLSQIIHSSTDKIAKAPFFTKIFFLREYNIFDKKNPTLYSSFEWELLKIKELLEKIDENSLVLIDEVGKSGSYIEGLSMALLLGKKLFQISAFTYFATHFSDFHLYMKKYEEEEKFVNIIHASGGPPYEVKSGIPIYSSITKAVIPEWDYAYAHNEKYDMSEIQFAIQLNNQ